MPKKNTDAGRDVMSSLPHSRPQRRSAKRGPAGSSGGGERTDTGAGAAKRKTPAKTKPRGATRAEPRGTGASARGGGPGPKRPLVTGPAPGRRAPTRAARAGAPVRVPRPIDPPGGAEILGAAVGAAGELAQMGLKVSGRLLRGAVGRLPHP